MIIDIQKSLVKASNEIEGETFDPYESLPVVERFCKVRLKPEIFRKRDILFIQHVLAPFIHRLELMEKYGRCDFDNCWFVDIPYSTSSIVKNKITKFCNKENFAKKHNDALALYSIAQKNRLVQVLKKIAENKRKLLIVDDGAYAVRALACMEMHEPEFVKEFCERGISVVEQTTRGHNIFTKNDDFELYLNFLTRNKISVISIAKTKTKYQIESPFIGLAVSHAILKEIGKFQKANKALEKILVIGFGAVGEATVKALLRKYMPNQVYVSEPKPSLTDEITKLGVKHVPKLDDSFFDKKTNQDYDAVIGCTGYGSFLPKDIKILNDNAVLASGSSAAIEFNRPKFLEKLMDPCSDFHITNKTTILRDGLHARIDMKKDSKRFSFINAGFPANFDGEPECLPPQVIQFTHALLVAASQETISAEPGFKELNNLDDDWIFEESIIELEKYR